MSGTIEAMVVHTALTISEPRSPFGCDLQPVATISSAETGRQISVCLDTTVVVVLGDWHAAVARERAIAREVIDALLDAKEAISYEASAAMGYINDERYEEHTSEILARTGKPSGVPIEDRFDWLVDVIGRRLDTTTAASAFRMSHKEAGEHLLRAAQRLQEGTARILDARAKLLLDEETKSSEGT